MPARSQDHVHRLIVSMSPAEKRGYKLHLSRNGHTPDRIQEQLFDAIARMERYDEAALLARFEGAAFTRHFAITKRRLYESILYSLEAFHADSSVDAGLNRLVHQVEILHQRALYDDALKILRSARKTAEHHQRLPALMLIREWERRNAECRNYNGTDVGSLERMALEDRELRLAAEELDSLWMTKSRLFLAIYSEGTASDPLSERLASVRTDHPLVAVDAAPRTAKARFLVNHIRSASAFAAGHTQECMNHLQHNLDLLEGERACFQDEPSLVLGVVSNLAYMSIHSGRYDKAFALLKKFRTLPAQWGMPETDDLDLKLFTTTTSLELGMHLRLGEFEKASELTNVVQRGLAQHAERVGPVRRAGLQYQLAYAQFGVGQMENSLRWTNELLNSTRADDHSDTTCAGRVLQLLILLELSKKDLLVYALRNTERFLRLRRRKNLFAPILSQFVRGMLSARNDSARKEAITRFRLALLPLSTKPSERAVFDHFDPIAWVESKLSGLPFALHARERARLIEQAA